MGPTNELDTLKRRLLQQSDWAAVSAACPLETKFATARELEQFGKRRKLTDSDRQRQAVEHGDKSLRGWANHRTNYTRPVQQDTGLSHLKVHIDGQLAGSISPGTHVPTTQTSSYSMLLDQDEPVSPFSPSLPAQPKSTRRGPCGVVAGRLSLPSSHMRAPLHLQPPASNVADTQEDGCFEHSDTKSMSRTANSRIDTTNHSPCYNRVEPEPVTFQSSFHQSATDVSPTRPRHFTIDDQLLAEQMQLNTTSNSRGQLPYMLSSEEGPSPSPTRILTDVSMDPETSSWLQHPQTLPYSSSPLRTRDTGLKRPAFHTATCTLPSSPSLVDEEGGAHPVPVKIFGQSVQLEERTLGL